MFTQDLAQDLPQDAVALELVLARAREHDISVTNETARDVLGALGLTAAKALRTIGIKGTDNSHPVLLFMMWLYK